MKIVLVSHGTYAQSLLDTAKMIIGPFENVAVFGIQPEEDLAAFEKGIVKELEKSKEEKEQTIVFTDIFFGTPFNTVTRLMSEYEIKHFAGINMPILLEVLTSKDTMDIEELCEYIKEIKERAFIDVNDYLSLSEE